MRHDINAYYADIMESIRKIISFIGDSTYQEYSTSNILKSAVERQFEIIGESLGRIDRDYPDKINSISNARSIIDFRNILIHGYDTIDDAIVWDIISQHLPVLKDEITRLLNLDNK